MFPLIPWKRKKGEDRGTLATREQHPLMRFREEMDAIFDRFLGDWPDFDRLWKGWPALREAEWEPAWGVEVDDRENEMVVRAAAPGFDPDEFDVRVSGNQLVIRAEHKQESQRGNGSSFHYGSLYPVLPLPKGIREDQIGARYHSGVLELTLPKGEEAKGKRIPIKKL
jgi:HSP20 family protein